MNLIPDNNWAAQRRQCSCRSSACGVMLFIPRSEEQLHKVVALVTALATLASASTLLATFDYDQAGKLQFFVNTPWIDVIHSRYIVGLDGISLPLYSCRWCIIVLVHHLLAGTTSPSPATRRRSSS